MVDITALPEGYSVMNVKKPVKETADIVHRKDYRGLIAALSPIFATSFVKVAALTFPLTATPMVAYADTFGDIHKTVMTLFDGGVVLIIIFAGAAWSLGHRSKAIELLIGVCCGYLLARHAVDIRDYLKGIGGGA